MAAFGRLLTAMATPFAPDGSLDEPRAADLARALVASGSEGLVVTGTTGESPTLTHDEKLRMYSIVREAVGDSAVVIAGTTNSNTAESVALSREAAELGVDGFLLVVPPYNKPTQEGMYRHFASIASATSLPCILYNIPGRTAANLLPSTVLRLHEFGNIVGIKEASGDFGQIATIIEACDPEFRVWSGDDNATLPILAIGGYGVISVSAHLVGRQIREMIDAFLAGETTRAAAIHRRHLPLINALFVVGSPVPLKYALGVAGFPVGECRLPLYGPDEETARLIRQAIERQQIDLPAATVV
ncbi:MAG: 4-hydroxy-tetrahydrodipicolinate synthase [Dehalococcoidia bacterium]